MKFMLDTNIFDRIVDCESVFEKVRSNFSDGKIKFITTPIQEEQLVKISESKKEKKERIASVPRENVPLSAYVLGGNPIVPSSANFVLGSSTLASDRELKIVEKIQRSNYSHTADALIAVTAIKYVEVLVTDDWKDFGKRVTDLQLEIDVCPFEKFREYIEGL